MELLYPSLADRILQERRLAHDIVSLGGPDIQNLTFRKQSHNAVVYQGELDEQAVFVKRYETDYGPKRTQKAITETQIVLEHFKGRADGIARILWASEQSAIVVMSEAAGQALTTVLNTDDCLPALHNVARWFNDYVGNRREKASFNTRYWVKQRRQMDVSGLKPYDQKLMKDLLVLQRSRSKKQVSIASVKGCTPGDFAPHNLHWTGEGVFGFDIEGHSHQPLVKAAVRFAVLASKRIEKPGDRLFGLPAECLTPFMNVLDGTENGPNLWPYLAADLMYERFVRRYADQVTRDSLRQSIQLHLATS